MRLPKTLWIDHIYEEDHHNIHEAAKHVRKVIDTHLNMSHIPTMRLPSVVNRSATLT